MCHRKVVSESHAAYGASILETLKVEDIAYIYQGIQLTSLLLFCFEKIEIGAPGLFPKTAFSAVTVEYTNWISAKK